MNEDQLNDEETTEVLESLAVFHRLHLEIANPRLNMGHRLMALNELIMVVGEDDQLEATEAHINEYLEIAEAITSEA